MEYLVEGVEQRKIGLQCPHCKTEENYPVYAKPSSFVCVFISCLGVAKVWFCTTCKKHFCIRYD